MEPIEFAAQVYKVQTLADNGIRVTLDLAEGETLTMAKLAECQRFGVGLAVTATPLKNNEEQHAIREGPERKSRWTPPQE